MTVGDETFTTELTIDRVGELTGENSPFEAALRDFVKRVERGR